MYDHDTEEVIEQNRIALMRMAVIVGLMLMLTSLCAWGMLLTAAGLGH